MRTILAVVLAITILFGGLIAISTQGQSVQDAAVANGTNASADAYNFTTEVFEGVGAAFGPAVVWLGLGAVVLIALGLLTYAAQSGR